MQLCKRCKKREVNTERSSGYCNHCLDYLRDLSARLRQTTDLSLRIKNSGDIAVLNGRCRACHVNPIYTPYSTRYCEHCLSKRREANIRYKNSNKKEEQRRTQNWLHKHPEKIREYSKRNYDLHGNEYKLSRRARIHNAIGRFSKSEWEDVKYNYGNKCLWCGRDDVVLTADHVVPLSDRGTNLIENIQPLCASCNSRKHCKTIDFRPFGSSILEWT